MVEGFWRGFCEQDCWRHPERSCDPMNVLEADIPLAALNSTHIAAIQIGCVRKSLLRSFCSQSQRPHLSAEGKPLALLFRSCFRHPPTVENRGLCVHGL